MIESLINFAITHMDPSPKKEDVTLKKLFGQASYREYFRLSVNHQEQNSYVIMKLPHGFESPSEEITKENQKAPKEFPFINIQHYLSHLGLPVPKIYATNPQQGLILLEDLGDDSLENIFSKAGPSYGIVYYKNAIDLLVNLQIQTTECFSKNCVAFYKQFDQDLLNYELNHFLEYGIEDRLNIKLSNEDKDGFNTFATEISNIISHQPQGFTHRDFQSRNLMFKNYHLYLIDFQDALVGPVLYDLVALLRDSYINIPDEMLNTLLDYYLNKLTPEHPYYNKKEEMLTDFYLITIQRKLKDAGRFQFIKTKKNNPDFLTHVPQSLYYVKHAFSKLLERNTEMTHLKQFHSLISQYIEELK